MPAIRCGLIGAHIGRSRLARGLEILCDGAGLTLDFTPLDTATLPGFDFDDTVARLRDEGWTGVTVTHPWKPDAARFAGGAMVPGTEGLGAANTLIFRPKLSGHNTDFTGFLAAWRALMPGAPGRVAMAGAGGVARALAPALATLGATDIAIWDPTPGLAAALARDTGGPARAIAPKDAKAAIEAADGLVNATPMGMAEYPGSAFDPRRIGTQGWAFDAVYTPTDTAFLMSAAAAGLRVLTGFDLFRFMALGSFEAYTGIAPDPATALPALDPLRPIETAHAPS